jgi:dipeptidyl aminopeptidase/acylaminoacyl peptidase
VSFQQVIGTNVVDDVFWSPSSADLFFTADDGLLRRINPFHGAAQTVFASSAGVLLGGTVNRDGTILLGSPNSILRLNGPGGSPMPMTLEDGAAQHAFRIYPQFLPDGRHFIYLVTTPGSPGAVHIGAIDSKETQPLLTAASAAIYSKDGYLLFVKGTALMAERFDARTFALRGDPVLIASNAASGMLGVNGNAGFSVADDGTLAYIPTKAGKNGQLTWFDRSGNMLGSIKQPPDTEYLNPSISPDGKHLAVNAMDPETGNWDIWLIDLDSQIPTRLTTDPAQDSDAIWSPDGNEIVFASTRGGGWGLYRKKLGVNGSEELLLKTDFECIPTDWTRDGLFIVYGNNTAGGVLALPMSGSDRKPIAVTANGFFEYGAKVSPDGKWIAYASEETGDSEIYVQGFPINANRQRVSSEGGMHPRWT